MPLRTRQLKRLIDYMISAWPEAGRIDPARIGAFGFSSGGFTVLAAAGGTPDLAASPPTAVTIRRPTSASSSAQASGRPPRWPGPTIRA